MKISIFFVCIILLFGCGDSRHFYYPFSKANKDLITKVYTDGKISCGIYDDCLRLDTIISDSNKFVIKGGPRRLKLNQIIVQVTSEKEGKEFDVNVKSSSLLFKNDEFNSKLLDEITSELFTHNDYDLQRFLEESKKSNKTMPH